MTGRQAINKAMQAFDKTVKEGDIRGVVLLEGTGSGDNWKTVNIQIEYSIDGDYSQSDKNPFIVEIREDCGVITSIIQ